MRDNNQILTDANVAADAFAANAIAVNKTPAQGIWLQFVITRNDADADEVLDITIYGKDTDAAWAVTDTPVGITSHVVDATVADGGTVVLYALVQAAFAYIKPHYNVGGTTPDFTIVCSVVSGPQRDTTA